MQNCKIVAMGRPLLKLNQAVMDISPFAHVPRLPGAPLELTPIVALTTVAALLTVVGLAGFRRRDIPIS